MYCLAQKHLFRRMIYISMKSLNMGTVDMVHSFRVQPTYIIHGHVSQGYNNKNRIGNATSIIFLSTVSLLRVKVPVLSLQSTSIPAISSIAVILFVMAPCTKFPLFYKFDYCLDFKSIVCFIITIKCSFINLLRQAMRTDGHSYRKNCWHSNWDATDE